MTLHTSWDATKAKGSCRHPPRGSGLGAPFFRFKYRVEADYFLRIFSTAGAAIRAISGIAPIRGRA